MGENLEVLLSDEFVEFSQKIADVHARKKAKQEELKVIYDTFKADAKALDEEAKGLQKNWKEWVRAHTKPVVTPEGGM